MTDHQSDELSRMKGRSVSIQRALLNKINFYLIPVLRFSDRSSFLQDILHVNTVIASMQVHDIMKYFSYIRSFFSSDSVSDEGRNAGEGNPRKLKSAVGFAVADIQFGTLFSKTIGPGMCLAFSVNGEDAKSC